MSSPAELIDSQQARQYVMETWAQARAEKLSAAGLMSVLHVALELVNEGEPLTHLGFMSDCISSLLPSSSDAEIEKPEVWSCPPVDSSLVRQYEDYVLGKFAADMSLQRASDELHKYKNRELDRALAYALQQIRARAQLPGMLIAPAVIKGLLSRPSAALHDEFETALAQGFQQTTLQLWDDVTQRVRNAGELLGVEDIFELSSGTALSKFGQRIALRQVMQAAQYLATGLPKQKPGGPKRHFAVATNILEEDLYPVGGFSSIANRGTMESLLRSELAYMEVDDRPDLFDIRYARDELLYYSRDENQFFRRRVTIMFVLDCSLDAARVKDHGSAWQRIVLTLAVVVAMVRTLTDWLASDALKFEVLLEKPDEGPVLNDEREVLAMIFQPEIQAGRLALQPVDSGELARRIGENARQSCCLCVAIHAKARNDIQAVLTPEPKAVTHSPWQPLVSELNVAEPLPVVTFDDQRMAFEESNDPWRDALRELLGSLSF